MASFAQDIRLYCVPLMQFLWYRTDRQAATHKVSKRFVNHEKPRATGPGLTCPDCERLLSGGIGRLELPVVLDLIEGRAVELQHVGAAIAQFAQGLGK